MKRIVFFLLFLFIATNINAQHANVKRFTAPLAGTVVLSAIDDKYNAQAYSIEPRVPDGNADKVRLRMAKEASANKFPRKKVSIKLKTTAAAIPNIATGFVSDSISGIPPDNDMAVSAMDSGVAVMNSRLAVLDVKNGKIVKRTTLSTFSKAVGLNDQFNDYRYDPKILYDPEADKYICVMLNSTNQFNYIVVGFSQTNAPQGAWNFYKFYGDYKGDTTWFDYPAIVLTKDEFFLTGNKIKFNSNWQTGFTESVIYQINKNDGYSGAGSLNYQIWDSINHNGKTIRNLFPVKEGKGLGGPSQYFLSNRNFDVQNDTVFIVKVPDLLSSGNQNLTVDVLKSPLFYGVPPNGRQPDTSVVLATNDGRILGAYSQNGEIQFVCTSVDPANGSAGIYHARIANYKTSPVIDHAHIFSVDTLDFGYPNISLAHNPWSKMQSIISFNYTGPNTYPGVGAINFDGTDYSALLKIKEGDNSISVLGGKEQRWGDYTGSQIDYNNTGGVWIVGIYGRKDKRYGNWMAKLNSPLLSVKEGSETKTLNKVYPNPAFQFIHLEFENPQKQVLSFAIYDATGKLVDKILDQNCKKGRNIIQFDIASLPAGTYVLKGIGADGNAVMTERFVRN